MKKKILSVMLIAVLAISSSLVACGNDTKSEGDTSKPTVSKENDESSNKEKTVEDWLNDPIVSKQLKEQTPDGYTVTAKGNNLIYTIKQPTQVEVNDLVVDALKTGLDAQEETFKTLANGIKNEINISEITITFNFTNADDSEIYSHELVCK